jgi:NAD(P)-dependent dehydrogenase (short-subunit alcohol dehydrogenase family)
MERGIESRKVLVVGASKGIGRAVAVHLGKMGARAVVSGRDIEALGRTVEECGGEARAVTADVRVTGDCDRLVEQAVAVLGGLDALVYCPGTTRFTELATATGEDWRTVFETNLFAAANCTRAALPHLTRTRGHAIYFSSNAVESRPPWEGLGIYVASKLALESAIRSWQLEVPDVAFSCLRVGPTVSEFRDSHPEGARFGALWLERGHIDGNRLDPLVHARAIEAILREDAAVTSITTVPRPLSGSRRDEVTG